MAKILFIPRLNSDQSYDTLLTQAKSWPEFRIVTYGQDQITNADLSSPATEIYVFGGHCSASQAYLGWPGNHDNRLDYSEVVTRLLEGGLAMNKGFSGHVKIYSCQSGEKERMDQAGRPQGKGADLGAMSFAQKFMERLREKGIQNCTVWGYSGNVSTALVNRMGKSTGADLQLRATPPAKGRAALPYSRLASDAEVRMG